jgi:hypothetical protein
MEECAEPIQAICKGERFGYDDRNPLIENAPTCRQRVLDEMADVRNALNNFKSWLNKLPEDIKRRDEEPPIDVCCCNCRHCYETEYLDVYRCRERNVGIDIYTKEPCGLFEPEVRTDE